MKEYIENLRKELNKINYKDVDGIIEYFEEMIKDRLDNGESEEDILNDLEDPIAISKSLSKEVSLIDFKEETKEIIEERSEHLEFNDINDIDIEVVNFEIEINGDEDNEVIIDTIYGEKDELKIYAKGHKLYFEQLNNTFNLFGRIFFKSNIDSHTNNSIRLSIPNEMIDSLNIENVSGNTTINSIIVEDSEIETVSGSIDIYHSEFNELNIESVSGSIKADELIVQNELNVETISGNTSMNELQAHDINFESVSGDINVNIIGDINTYEIDIEKVLDEKHKNGGPHSLNIETVSGDIDYSFSE